MAPAFKLISRGEGPLRDRYRPQRLSEIVPTFSMKDAKSILEDPNASQVWLFEGITGSGKCLGEGTLVLMADGRTVPVEQVCAGDRLMGPDGAARTVTSMTSGRGPLYRVDPIKGEPWVCNDVHILTLVHSVTGVIVDIALDDYLKRSNRFKHEHKLFSVGVDAFENPPPYVNQTIGDLMAAAFADLRATTGLTQRAVASRLSVKQTTVSRMERGLMAPSSAVVERVVTLAEDEGFGRALCEPLPKRIDPYFLGVWFGDGSHSSHNLVSDKLVLCNIKVCKPDPEIRDICEKVACEWGLCVKTYNESSNPTHALVGRKGHHDNKLLYALRDLVGTDLAIPDAVLRGPRDLRLEFLAGFLDTDGHLSNNCFNITQKREDWARAIWFIARSLGLRATWSTRTVKGYEHKGLYYRVSISGDTDMIPTRIPRKQSSPRRQKKNALRTGFKVVPIGDGDYYGFTLTGDGRFLLGDFTVTHNTTLSRVIARAAICEADGDVEKPCLTCEACTSMEREPDYTEINIANFRGVDSIRDKIAGMCSFPGFLKRKIYIFDEAHQLTPQAQELMNKVLEEPIGDTLIFLCTTNKKGLKRTLLGRCAKLNFKRISRAQIASVIEQVVVSGGDLPTPTKDELDDIAMKADGSVRDLLNILDTVNRRSYKMGLDDVEASGIEGAPNIFKLVEAYKAKDWDTIREILATDNVKNDPDGYRETVCAFLAREALKNPLNMSVAVPLGQLAGSLWNEPKREQHSILVLRSMRACVAKK